MKLGRHWYVRTDIYGCARCHEHQDANVHFRSTEFAGCPGWEGSIGPGKGQYNKPHVYARDVHSGAGNCVCGSDPGHDKHVQIAPGVPVPDRMRHG